MILGISGSISRKGLLLGREKRGMGCSVVVVVIVVYPSPVVSEIGWTVDY